MKSSVGAIIRIQPPPENLPRLQAWVGVKCQITSCGDGSGWYTAKIISDPPEGWRINQELSWTEKWFRLDVPLSPFEQSIQSYIDAEKKELGL